MKRAFLKMLFVISAVSIVWNCQAAMAFTFLKTIDEEIGTGNCTDQKISELTMEYLTCIRPENEVSLSNSNICSNIIECASLFSECFLADQVKKINIYMLKVHIAVFDVQEDEPSKALCNQILSNMG